MKRFALILCLLMTGWAGAATYYCDAAAGGAGAGTEGDPWDWTDATASGNITGGGNLIYCKGAFGDIDFRHTDAVGASGNHNLYTTWPAQSDPTCTKFIHSGPGGPSEPLYVTFQNFSVTAGGGTTTNSAVTMSRAGNITYDNCTFTGQFNSNITVGMSDFYPQFLDNDSAITTINTPCANLTFTDCTFLTSWRFANGQQADNWTFTNCTFTTCSEDGVVFSNAGSGCTITGCTFSGQDQQKGTMFWPASQSGGVATGTWAGHEYETCTQDNTGDTGLFVSVTTAWKCYPNRTATQPDKTSTDVWRLDSDPSNIYYTPNGAGDEAHGDYIAINGTSGAYTFTISKNKFTTAGSGGQGTILDGNTGTTTNFTNNIYIHLSGVTNAVLQGGTGSQTSNWYNNIIDTGSSTNGMTINADIICNLYNNIIGGITTQSGTVTSDYNIWQNASVHASTIAGEANALYSQDFSTGFFTNYASQIFTTLNVSSPQVDIGDATFAPADDFIGTSRPQNTIDDIGPYELIQAAPVTQRYLF